MMKKKGIAVLLVLITIWTLLAGCASKPSRRAGRCRRLSPCRR